MTNLEAVKALQKADVLKKRGRGSGGYYYDDNTIYDAGCFDWEIVCTPEGGYTQEYDFSHYENMSNDEYYGYYDQDTHTHPMGDNPSDLIQRGIEVVNGFINGDNPIVVSDKVIEVANLTSMGLTMKVNLRQIINYHRMIFIIKSCIRCRLINEKLNNAKSIGKGLSFFTATSLATCGVIGLFELLSLVFDGLSFLGDKRVGVIVFIIASIVSLVLAKSDYYENLHDYIDTLDDETLRKTRKRDVMIVIMTGSVFWVAILSIIIKAIVTQYL